mgnify:CR=1 FL=1
MDEKDFEKILSHLNEIILNNLAYINGELKIVAIGRPSEFLDSYEATGYVRLDGELLPLEVRYNRKTNILTIEIGKMYIQMEIQ